MEKKLSGGPGSIQIKVILLVLATIIALATFIYTQTLISQLEKRERDILALAISDGLSYRDIASIVDISVENVKVKVHRTRLKLKKILQRGDES